MVAKSDRGSFASDAADAALIVPVTTLAAAFNMTPRRVQQLVEKGVLPKEERGRYPLIAAVSAYVSHLEAKPQVAPGDLDPAQERARKDRALAITAELRNDVTLGKLVSADDVLETMGTVFRTARNHFLSLPSKITQIVPREYRGNVFERAEQIVHDALNEMADAEVLSSQDTADDERDDLEGGKADGEEHGSGDHEGRGRFHREPGSRRDIPKGRGASKSTARRTRPEADADGAAG